LFLKSTATVTTTRNPIQTQLLDHSNSSEVVEVQNDPDLMLPPSQQSTADPNATKEPPEGANPKVCFSLLFREDLSKELASAISVAASMKKATSQAASKPSRSSHPSIGTPTRTNCMGCLDRTNVVQSACGRNVLEVTVERGRSASGLAKRS
jgi:hypothetical protein